MKITLQDVQRGYDDWAAPSPPAAVQEPVAVKAEDIEIIEEVVGGYDWLGTGSYYDHAGKREAEQAWSRIRSALSTSQSDPAPEIAALRAENERLRKALQPFALMSTEGVVKHITNYSTVTTVSDYFHTAARALAEPRAAVAPEQEEAK